MAINETVKKLRKRAHLTQVELSERAGVGLRFTKELERGKPTARMDKINQVLEFFGYQLDAVKCLRVFPSQVNESNTRLPGANKPG